MFKILPRVSASARTTTPTAASVVPSAPRVWAAPVLVELPRLADLTLQTGAAIDGSGSSGGVTFP